MSDYLGSARRGALDDAEQDTQQARCQQHPESCRDDVHEQHKEQSHEPATLLDRLAPWEADAVDIFRAEIADVGDAAPLFAAYREFYGEPYDIEASREFLAERVGRGESVVILARDEGRCVGLVQVYPAFSSTALAPIWILNDLYVDEAARGSGVVDRLLTITADLAQEAGCVAIELATQHTNTRAQAVYARHGYVADEEFRHYEKPLRPE